MTTAYASDLRARYEAQAMAWAEHENPGGDRVGFWRAESAAIGHRAAIGHQARVGQDAYLGVAAFVGAGAVVGREGRLEHGAHLGASATLGQRAELGQYAGVGEWGGVGPRAGADAGAFIGQGVRVGAEAVVSQGARIEDARHIAGALARSDGRVFSAYVCAVRGPRITVACRDFSPDEARAHWGGDGYRDPALGREALAIVEGLLAVLAARGVIMVISAG